MKNGGARPKVLSAAFVRAVSAPGRYGDGRGGHGLSLWVREQRNGRTGKIWSQRLRIGGKPVNLGLGSYPRVSLALARERALANAQSVEHGEDPRVKPATMPTFAEAVETWVAEHEGIWREGGRQAEIVRSAMERFVYPTMKDTPVDQITTADLRLCLSPIWAERTTTAKRLKRYLSGVMAWSIGAGHRTDDPAGLALDASLPKVSRVQEHQRAVAHSEITSVLAKIDNGGAWPGTKLAFRFLVLTGARSGEVRYADWSEIDLDARCWNIPGERTKTGRPHDVPLSSGAMEVLNAARELGQSGLIFPSLTGKAMSDNTLSKMLRDLGIPGTPHGCRSTLRDWCAENGVSREIAEAILAHVVTGVEGAYFRSDLYQQRARVMQDWADYVLG